MFRTNGTVSHLEVGQGLTKLLADLGVRHDGLDGFLRATQAARGYRGPNKKKEEYW